jgi:hypothetical protein
MVHDTYREVLLTLLPDTNSIRQTYLANRRLPSPFNTTYVQELA